MGALQIYIDDDDDDDDDAFRYQSMPLRHMSACAHRHSLPMQSNRPIF